MLDSRELVAAETSPPSLPQGWFLAYQMPVDSPLTLMTAAGLLVWLLGFSNVVVADATLVALRKPGETGYKIPRGGLFELGRWGWGRPGARYRGGSL